MSGSAAQGPRPHSTRRDLVVIVVIVAVVACLAIGIRAAGNGAGGGDDGGTTAVARITDGDGATYEMPLDADGVRTITTSLGTNVVEVKDGRVRVLEADCPNQDCVNQGWIDSPSQQIVCLPHKLYVDIVSGDGQAGAGTYDVVGR